MCTFFQDARWDQIRPRGLVSIQCFLVFFNLSGSAENAVQSSVYYVVKLGNLLFVCVYTDEKYMSIS